MSGTLGHNALNGCKKCTQVGRRSNNVTTFSDTVGIPITDVAFRNRLYPNHHLPLFKESQVCLEELNFDMIAGFPVV